jgi:hypothetical protein
MLLLQIQALQMAFKRGRCITSWEKAFTNKHSPLVLGLVLTPASQQPDEPTKRKSSPATFCSTTVRRTAVITPREVRHENLNMGSYQHRQRRGKAVAAARGGAPVAAHGPNGGAVGSGGEEGEHHAQNVRMDACPRRGLPAPHVESWPILVVLGAFRRTHRLRTKRPRPCCKPQPATKLQWVHCRGEQDSPALSAPESVEGMYPSDLLRRQCLFG